MNDVIGKGVSRWVFYYVQEVSAGTYWEVGRPVVGLYGNDWICQQGGADVVLFSH